MWPHGLPRAAGSCGHLTVAQMRECTGGAEVEEVFEAWDATPVASGSVAQIYRARLGPRYSLPVMLLLARASRSRASRTRPARHVDVAGAHGLMLLQEGMVMRRAVRGCGMRQCYLANDK
jgi:hypothetical protein